MSGQQITNSSTSSPSTQGSNAQGSNTQGRGSPNQRALPAQGQLQVIDDPLLDWLRDNWRSMVITVAVVGALTYGWNVYRSTNQAAQRSSGDSFVALQRSFDELASVAASAASLDQPVPSSPESAKADAKPSGDAVPTPSPAESARARFESQVRSLSFAKAPYPALGEFYQKVAQLKNSDERASELRTQTLSSAAYRSLPSDSLTRLTSELLFLAAARATLTSDVSHQSNNTKHEGSGSAPQAVPPAAINSLMDQPVMDRNAGWQALEQLAKDGQYAAGAAVATLKQRATSPEQQARAESLKQEVLARRPELAEALNR